MVSWTRTSFIGLTSSHCVLAGTEPLGPIGSHFCNLELGLHALVLFRHEQRAAESESASRSAAFAARTQQILATQMEDVEDAAARTCACTPALAVVLV